MTDKIPDDVMEAALDIVGIIREHKNCEEEYNTFQIRYREAIDIVARAILSERESATKAERERCAGIARDFVKSSREKFDTCISDSAEGKRNLEYAAACAVGLCSASEHIAQLIESDERDGGDHG